jgi:hypothetical protein
MLFKKSSLIRLNETLEEIKGVKETRVKMSQNEKGNIKEIKLKTNIQTMIALLSSLHSISLEMITSINPDREQNPLIKSIQILSQPDHLSEPAFTPIIAFLISSLLLSNLEADRSETIKLANTFLTNNKKGLIPQDASIYDTLLRVVRELAKEKHAPELTKLFTVAVDYIYVEDVVKIFEFSADFPDPTPDVARVGAARA